MRTKKPIPGLTESQVMEGVREALAIFGLDVARQNTGGATNAKGRLVTFGRPGNSDWSGMIPAGWGPASGRKIDIEVKRESFDPGRLRGEKRAHFDRQLSRLKTTCENGGYGLWCNDARQVVHALTRIRDGWKIEWDGDFPYLTDESEA
jgi:hypothetical protein